MVAASLTGMSWTRDIRGAQTIPVLVQNVLLYQQLQVIQLSPGVANQLDWRWSVNEVYSSRSTYAALFMGQAAVLGVKELWKTKAPNKCRCFMWLVLLDRCWTAERLQRHGIHSSSSYILCCQGVESVDHLTIQCVISREVWFKTLRRYGWHGMSPGVDDRFDVWWTATCKRVPKARHNAFDSLVIAVVWSIWVQRNDRTFRTLSQTTTGLVDCI
jgi:hypothetical protein